MKINEIEYGAWNEPTLPEDQPITGTNLVGNFDGYDIYQLEDYLVILDDQNLYTGYIRLAASGNNDLVFKEAYVPEKHRRKGIATILILFVLRDLQRRLVLTSGEIVTDDSRNLFYKLLKLNKIKITSNSNQLSVEEFGKICLDIEENDLVLVIESKQYKEKSLTCYEIRNPTHHDYAVINEVTFGNITRKKMWFD